MCVRMASAVCVFHAVMNVLQEARKQLEHLKERLADEQGLVRKLEAELESGTRGRSGYAALHTSPTAATSTSEPFSHQSQLLALLG